MNHVMFRIEPEMYAKVEKLQKQFFYKSMSECTRELIRRGIIDMQKEYIK